ncbi:MAG: AMP-binding protein [Planctomycetota bacterium]
MDDSISLDLANRWQTIVEQSTNLSIQESYVALQSWRSQWEKEYTFQAPIWLPDSQVVAESNLGQWMRRKQTSNYHEFHRWTVTDRAAFWEEAIEVLSIQFRHPATQTLDTSIGIDRPAWFDGAKLNIVESCFQADPNQVAIISQKPGHPIQKMTYGELWTRANQVANSIADHGFKLGDAIGVVMPMTPWSVAIYLGIIMAGCHVVSIADSFAPPEIATRLNIAGAKAVFTYDQQIRGGKKLPLYRKVAEASDISAIVLHCDQFLSLDLREQDLDWSEFLVDRTEFGPVECTVNETINVLFSSGTTGDPKAIPWNHLTPIKCALDGYCHQDIRVGDVVAWPTNLGWMMGPWLIFASLINQATIALYEDTPIGKGFGKFVQDAKVTMLGVVPTIVKAWEASGDMEEFDWHSIKVFSSTGESSQQSTMTYLSVLGGIKPVIEYCGGTEIGGGYVTSVVVLPNFPAAFNTPAVGLDFVMIERDESNLHKIGESGEVFLIPPSIGLSVRLINRDHFETYYQDAPKMEGLPALRRHGDYFQSFPTFAGRVFAAGGRADDTMNLGGIKISSAEIERVLNSFEGIVETAAVGYSTHGGPNELHVFLVTADPNFAVEPTQTEMNHLLKNQLNPLFKIRQIHKTDSLPRTASGKVMRRLLRDRLSSSVG